MLSSSASSTRSTAPAAASAPDSELTRVNRAGGERVAVGPLLLEALRVALDAARSTGGLVDPTVGRALRVSGYDSTFRVVAARDGDTFRAEFCAVPGWQTVELDEDAATVRVLTGVELDLGATAKALACDRAAAAAAAVAGGVLVGIGGDIGVAGDDAGGRLARADRRRPRGATRRARADRRTRAEAASRRRRRLCAAGAAARSSCTTSSIPRTGRPAESPWRTVSVAAKTCVDANVASTASFLLDDAPRWLEAHGLPARLVSVDGEMHVVAGWPEDGA